MKKNRINAVLLIICILFLFSGCKSDENDNLSIKEQAFEDSTYLEDNIKCEIISSETEKFFNEYCTDIKINNTIFALPMYVSDLPEGFSIEYIDNYSEKRDTYIHKYENENFAIDFERLIFDEYDIAIANTYIMHKKSEPVQDGIIVGLSIVNGKASFGEVNFSDTYDEIISKMGEPSIDVGKDSYGQLIYLCDDGSFVVFTDVGYFSIFKLS